ncbi:C1-like protein [Corchorus olitorius]|uniref:C1-like protein n=1 Tax=Corchorus olitorius TaxID=93759 RepID=A0A1R3HIG5_9ROSI|nr:C1-like protein [Corchorus olitorius]
MLDMEGGETEMGLLLQHFCHEHGLLFVQDFSPPNDEAVCSCCMNRVEGPSYYCGECKFYLHKKCAEIELAPEINHPFHPKHPLTLLPKSPYNSGRYMCNVCGRGGFSGFVYHCASCEFDLDVNCALLQTSGAEKFPKYLHHHPMLLIENHKEQVRHRNCRGCKQPLSGPIYKCSDCDKLYLDKKCVELPLHINHPYDRIHPLSLIWRNPTAHQQNCSCFLCKIKWDGLFYCCSLCNIELTPEDVSAPPTISVATHQHPWTLLSSQISFTCDFCGVGGDRTPYICTTCDLILHKNCISMPKAIRIARHPHPISHVYSIQQTRLQELECRICHENVNARYGCYCCSASKCNYIAHVTCATNEDVWDGTVVLEDDIEMWKAGLGNEPMNNMITDVISEVSVGEDVMAIEIKHAYHHHNLILTFTGENEMKDDNICCDGCMLPISTPFYTCQQCRFFDLHKTCAELPREKGVPAHKHVLKLTKNDGLFWCHACNKERQGFSYKCDQEKCYFLIDVQCSLLPDIVRHPSHQHSLFLSHNFQGLCSGCHTEYSKFPIPAYRCTKRCDFAIDFGCLVLPFKAGYKYDKHPLTLTYTDNSDPNQLYCDFCEEERDSRPWFYHCSDCDNSLHKECALGQLPFSKRGSTYRYSRHKHPLTFVDNIWNCPLCIACGKVCYRQALECKESGCNFTVHWNCRWELQS